MEYLNITQMPFDPSEFTMIGWILSFLVTVLAGLTIAGISNSKKQSKEMSERLSRIDTTLQVQNAKYDNILDKISDTGRQLNEIFRTINHHGRAIAQLQALLKVEEKNEFK